MPVVALLGTLDTKGTEYAWLRDRLLRHAVEVVLIDAGVAGEPLVAPDIPRAVVASAAGADAERLRRGRATAAPR